MDGYIGKSLILVFFVPIFLVGLSGNFWVIFSLVRAWPRSTAYAQMTQYILLLSIADLFVLFMTPVVTSYFLLNSFVFGEVGCKIYFAIENVNKLLSVAILVLMALERFLVVVRPFGSGCCRSSQKPTRNVILIVVILVPIIVCLCFPIIYYAQLNEMVDMRPDGTLIHLATLCMSTLPEGWMGPFSFYMFVLGYVLPVCLVTICYAFLIRHLQRNNQRMTSTSSSSKRVRSVVRSVLAVILFHFVCWTPFWFFIVVPMLSLYRVVDLDFLIGSDFFQTARMISSFMPYLNAAGNWIFYSQTITHAQAAQNRRRSQRTTTFHEQLKRSLLGSKV
ncbi:putative G-protein coupled receptor C06G4.5 [Aphelenchoides fujianensis]|nr:putative G-protein coupled receptor C06G4.5 [Aphelenchoides fujianensis]